jgi:hypothetical protein
MYHEPTRYTPPMSIIRKLALLLLVAITFAGESPSPSGMLIEQLPERIVNYPPAGHVPLAITIEPERADLDVPDTCDRLLAVETPSGRQLTKIQPLGLGRASSRADQQRWIRGLVNIVGDELGADAIAREVVYRKAILESSGNHAAVHVRTADIEANRRAARRGRAVSSKRWARARVPVYKRHRKQLEPVGTYDAWALGRGLYGQVTGLHLSRWSTDAPPWSLCDPIIATVTTFWSMRAGLEQCDGETMRDAYRRFASGRCALREPSQERAFDRLASGRVRGLKLAKIDPEAPAKLGTRWPEDETDRAILLAKLRRRVADELGAAPQP